MFWLGPFIAYVGIPALLLIAVAAVVLCVVAIAKAAK